MKTSVLKCLILIFSIHLMLSCSKEDDKDPKLQTENLLVNGKWNRISMETSPKIILPKQDGSGEFFTINDLMELKNLEGYHKNLEGFYSFGKDGSYTFTQSDDPTNNAEGIYSLDDNHINAVNSKNEKLTYTILEITNSKLVMEVPTIFFGQQTTIKIVCRNIL